MALLQLAANQNLINMQNISEENVSLLFNNRNNLIIQRNCDICKIKHLVIKFNNNFNITTQNYKELIKNIKLEIVGGGSTLLNIPIDLLCEITNPIINNNKLIIFIQNYFNFDIILAALQYHEVRLNIIYNDNYLRENINTVELLATYVYHDLEYRRRLVENEHNILIQQLNMTEFTSNMQNTRFRLNDNGFTKGYFIYTNVNNINQLSLRLNGHDRFVYDETMITMFCNKINDNLLYVPFIYNETPNFMNNTTESYIGSLYSSRVDNVEMIFRFNNTNNQRSYIYSVNSESLRIGNGMIGISNSSMLRNNVNTNVGNNNNTNPIGNNVGNVGNVGNVNGNINPIVIGNSVGNTIGNINSIASNVIFTNFPTTRPNNNVTTWTEETKPINDRNAECPISYIEFTLSCKYCCCSICNTNFDKNTLTDYFASLNTNTKKCPMCRSIWTNYVIYTNDET